MGNINEHDFLENWKKVTAYAIYDGIPDIINMPECSVEQVEDKNQLRPNVDALLSKTTLSMNTLLFYTTAFSYFNNNVAARVIEHFEIPQYAGRVATGSNLDLGRKEVLCGLMLSYQGW